MVHFGVLYISERRWVPPKHRGPGVAYPPLTPPSQQAWPYLATFSHNTSITDGRHMDGQMDDNHDNSSTIT